ncbi:MAG: radical SAM family heme chaperone HemW [Pseudomonadota bacterium]
MLAGSGLYIHLPWCIKKCPYCDFNSHPINGSTDFSVYGSCLQQDLAHQLDLYTGPAFASVFIGGGTPSLCPPEVLANLLKEVPLQSNAEVTMEANPGATEHHQFADYRAAGINRLSLGAQSFHPAHLKKLGRIHSPEATLQAYDSARKGGFDNINLDLMWGLPGQSVDAALEDLQQALSCAPEHLSWYQLTIEPKTEFAARPPVLPSDSRIADIERAGLDLLSDAGFDRYEVSAYAKAQHLRCAHNLNYWRFGDYLGIGAGAHGKHTDTTSRPWRVTRTRHINSPRAYQKDPCAVAHEPVANDQLTPEFMMNALRLTDGVAFEAFEANTGQHWKEFNQVWARLVELGLTRDDRCATTPLGLRYLDSVVAEFL